MNFSLTKSFEFSASYASGNRIVAHNYRLEATFQNVSELSGSELELKIQKSLIQKMHSRDLGQDVDFLRGVCLSDSSLLEAFWSRIIEIATPAVLTALSLQPDSHTRWTLKNSR
jgi:hypothetical protein